MRLLLAAGAATAMLLAPAVAVTGPASAGPGTDVTPPALGSCFDLTFDEMRAASSDEPPVPCSAPHTTTTFHVVEFAEAPDWNDEDSFESDVYDACNPAWVEVLGGNPKLITRSSYTYHWLMPTPAQRDAGAAWVRCELALLAGGRTAPLPQHVRLGSLPLSDAVARCREGEGARYRVTVCARPHQYRATYSVRIPGTRWRGEDRIQAFALRQCDERIRGDFYYQWPSSRYWWRLGFRFVTCLPRTRA